MLKPGGRREAQQSFVTCHSDAHRADESSSQLSELSDVVSLTIMSPRSGSVNGENIFQEQSTDLPGDGLCHENAAYGDTDAIESASSKRSVFRSVQGQLKPIVTAAHSQRGHVGEEAIRALQRDEHPSTGCEISHMSDVMGRSSMSLEQQCDALRQCIQAIESSLQMSYISADSFQAADKKTAHPDSELPAIMGTSNDHPQVQGGCGTSPEQNWQSEWASQQMPVNHGHMLHPSLCNPNLTHSQMHAYIQGQLYPHELSSQASTGDQQRMHRKNKASSVAGKSVKSLSVASAPTTGGTVKVPVSCSSADGFSNMPQTPVPKAMKGEERAHKANARAAKEHARATGLAAELTGAKKGGEKRNVADNDVDEVTGGCLGQFWGRNRKPKQKKVMPRAPTIYAPVVETDKLNMGVRFGCL